MCLDRKNIQNMTENSDNSQIRQSIKVDPIHKKSFLDFVRRNFRRTSQIFRRTNSVQNNDPVSNINRNGNVK